jgi:hypothetical protein
MGWLPEHLGSLTIAILKSLQHSFKEARMQQMTRIFNRIRLHETLKSVLIILFDN